VKLRSQFNLSFSCHLVVGNKVTALDSIKKNLLVLEGNSGLNRSYIINWIEVLLKMMRCVKFPCWKRGERKRKIQNKNCLSLVRWPDTV